MLLNTEHHQLLNGAYTHAASLDEVLFDKFLEMLELQGIKPQGGTFVEVPRQHNTKDENTQIKNGEVPKSFEANSMSWREGLRCKLDEKRRKSFWL